MSSSRPVPLVFVCATCARDAPAVDDTPGRRLSRALQAACVGDQLVIREVACLGGCRSPCNVALRGFGRWTYRFSRCATDDVEALLAAARAYWRAPRGELDSAALAPRLRVKLSVCTPPPA